jgi:hypothetical protein
VSLEEREMEPRSRDHSEDILELRERISAVIVTSPRSRPKGGGEKGVRRGAGEGQKGARRGSDGGQTGGVGKGSDGGQTGVRRGSERG